MKRFLLPQLLRRHLALHESAVAEVKRQQFLRHVRIAAFAVGFQTRGAQVVAAARGQVHRQVRNVLSAVAEP